jgi:hypothetical protein
MIQSESDFYRIIIVSRGEERKGREIASDLNNQTDASTPVAIDLSEKCSDSADYPLVMCMKECQ